MQPMFLHIIDDVLAKGSLDDPRDIVEVHAWGLAEAIAGERIEELMQHEDPRVAILMGAHGVTARVINKLKHVGSHGCTEETMRPLAQVLAKCYNVAEKQWRRRSLVQEAL